MTKTLLAAAALATLATSAQAGKYIPSPVAVVAIKDIATLNKPSPDTDVLKAAWIAKYLFFCAKPVPVDQYQPSERAANDDQTLTVSGRFHVWSPDGKPLKAFDLKWVGNDGVIFNGKRCELNKE